jgi:subtilisin family serine protease
LDWIPQGSKKILRIITVTILALLGVLHYVPSYSGELSPGLAEKLRTTDTNTPVPVIVRMSQQTDLKTATEGIAGRNRPLRLKRVIQSLKGTALEGQKTVRAIIKGGQSSRQVEHFRPFWIFNGFFMKATPGFIQQLALRDDVDLIREDFAIPIPAFLKSAPLQTDSVYSWNIERIRAQEAWEMGYDGSGVVVGILDTGVDVTHPDLSERFRGGDESWFDYHGEHEVPVDAAGWATGHGTHVAGIVLGGDKSGSPIGVAPGATWIAARMWNDEGDSVLSSDVHGIFEWFMDPDGDDATDDAPDVVNCSWSFDTFPWCFPELRDDVRAWREAGIIPVFAAGNSGPFFFSGQSPGNYPETISVGATTILDWVAPFSSRGPGNCDLGIFPDLVAPGTNIFSSFPDGTYQFLSGTSQAVPHVVGTIALMLSANPDLRVDEVAIILKQTAKPVGLFSPHFSAGWGQVDALGAVLAVIP